MNPNIYPPLTEREIRGAAIAENAAKEGMVLLKNENAVLPLKPGKIALFGNAAVRTVRGGTGSGDPFNGGLSGGGDTLVNQSPRYHINVLPSLKDAGFEIVNEASLDTIAAAYDEAMLATASSPMIIFSFPEASITAEEAATYAEETDIAVFVLSRNSGEGHDRKLDGDYNLTDTEKENLTVLRQAFKYLVLVLNVPGPVAVRDLDQTRADSILVMGQPGQEAGSAVTKVLSGETTPSGKLTTIWADVYDDYPSSDVFLSDFDTSLYTEGIYVGYRYFSTFGKKAGYPFGFGLSYTKFEVLNQKVCLEKDQLIVTADVKNIGSYSGKEVLQLYITAPSTEMDMPAIELKDFKKTGLLQPGETETLCLKVSLKDLSSYSEKETAYILSRGFYIVSLGTSSEDTEALAAVHISETVKIRLVYEELPLQQNLEVMTGPTGSDNQALAASLPVLTPEELPSCEDCRSPYQVPSVTTYTNDPAYQPVMPYEKLAAGADRKITFQDLLDGKASREELLSQLTEDQLADFCCGTGWGVEDDANPVIGGSSESVPGAAGETTHALEKEFGIPSIVMADGPGGVRLTQHFTAKNTDTGEDQEVFHHCIAWPVGTLIAQSFDEKVAFEVGLGMKEDLKAFRIGILLGPGINIHRNPLCGRNFEYFSEDPYLAGRMAASITLGIQDGLEAAACVKHYAANNQETNRSRNNSVVSQRALREIYLEPFRIAVMEGHPLSVMTSYNKINGIPSADSYDLCTNLLRGEWGFEGVVMTDWNGGSSTPSISMFAGNDMIMPGGLARRLNILSAVIKKAPEFDERGEVAKLSNKPFPNLTLLWNSFEVSKDGTSTAEACLGEGHTAEVKDGQILTDGEPVYIEAGTIADLFRDRQNFKPLKTPLTTEVADVSADGKKIIYKGNDVFVQSICKGDIQARAANILFLIEKLAKKS